MAAMKLSGDPVKARKAGQAAGKAETARYKKTAGYGSGESLSITEGEAYRRAYQRAYHKGFQG